MPELEELENVDADEFDVEVEFVAVVEVELPSLPIVDEADAVLVLELVSEALAPDVFEAEPPFELEEFEEAPVEAPEPEFESVPVCESAWLPFFVEPSAEPEDEPEAEPEVVPEPVAEPDAEEPLPDVEDVEVVFVADCEVELVVEVELLPVVTLPEPFEFEPSWFELWFVLPLSFEPELELVFESELALELELELLLELEEEEELEVAACAVFTEGTYRIAGKRELEMMIPNSITFANPVAVALKGLERFWIV